LVKILSLRYRANQIELLSSFHNNLTKNNKMPGKGKGKSAS